MRAVDEVEQAAAHHHRAGLVVAAVQDLGVDRVAGEDPAVDHLAADTQAVLEVGAGPGHISVEGNGDVCDNLAHIGLAYADLLRLSRDAAPGSAVLVSGGASRRIAGASTYWCSGSAIAYDTTRNPRASGTACQAG